MTGAADIRFPGTLLALRHENLLSKTTPVSARRRFGVARRELRGAAPGRPFHRGRLSGSPGAGPRQEASDFRRSLGALVTHVPVDEGLRLHGQGARAARRTVRLALD